MHVQPYHDFNWLLRTPGGAYITIVGLVFLCLFLFFVLGPICERLVRALGLQSAPSLKVPKQEARGETARPRVDRAGQASVISYEPRGVDGDTQSPGIDERNMQADSLRRAQRVLALLNRMDEKQGRPVEVRRSTDHAGVCRSRSIAQAGSEPAEAHTIFIIAPIGPVGIRRGER